MSLMDLCLQETPGPVFFLFLTGTHTGSFFSLVISVYFFFHGRAWFVFLARKGTVPVTDTNGHKLPRHTVRQKKRTDGTMLTDVDTHCTARITNNIQW